MTSFSAGGGVAGLPGTGTESTAGGPGERFNTLYTVCVLIKFMIIDILAVFTLPLVNGI